MAWLVNQFMFLCISYAVASVPIETPVKESKLLFHVRAAVGMSLGLIVVVAGWLWSVWSYSPREVFATGNFNHSIYPIEQLYWEKQALGNLLGIVFAYFVSGSRVPIVAWILIGTAYTFFHGIRTLWVALFGLLVWTRVRNGRAIAVAFIVLVALLPFFWSVAFPDIESEVRLAIFSHALSVMERYPLGVGHGIYHSYTESNEHASATGWYPSAGSLPTSPECDLVYVLCSFGPFLGLVYLAPLVWLVFRVREKFSQLDRMGRFFSCAFVFFFISGVFQDNMFSAWYWICFGGAIGATSFEVRQKIEIDLIAKHSVVS